MNQQHAMNLLLRPACVIGIFSLAFILKGAAAEEGTLPWKRSMEISPVTTQTAVLSKRGESIGTAHVDMALTKQPIEMAISVLANASKKTIILGEGERAQQVTVFFKDTPVDVALRAFAKAQRLCLVEQPDAILLVSRQEYLNAYAKTEIIGLKHANPSSLVGLLTQSQGGPAGQGSASGRTDLLVASADARTRTLVLKGDPEQVADFREACLKLDRSMTSEVFSIRYASVTAVAKEINDALNLAKDSIGTVISDERSNKLIVHETPENIELCRRIIESIDVQVESRVFSTGNIDPSKIAEQIKKGELGGTEKGDKNVRSQTKADATVQVVEGTNQIIVTDTPERLAILEQVMKDLNSNIETYIMQPQNSTPAQLADVVQKALPDVVVTTDPRSGSIIMSGHKTRITQAQELIRKVDAEENIQVVIETKIMLVSTDKLKQIGVRIYGQDLDGLNETMANVSVNPNFPADQSKPIGQSLGNPSSAVLSKPTKSTGNYLEVLQPNIQVQAIVRALESDGDTKVLSSPRLRMLTGQAATFFSGSDEPYKTTTFQNTQSVENVQFKKVGINFTVTPNVSPSRQIMLDVNTEFSTLREIRDGTPVVDTRSAQSIVQANDRETVLLSGLISQETGNQTGGIPVLRSIPLIGLLFGDKHQSASEKEMIIVITPTILTRDMSNNASLKNIQEEYSGIRHGFSEKGYLVEPDRMSSRPGAGSSRGKNTNSETTKTMETIKP